MLDEDKVVLNGVISTDGSIPEINKNKIIVSIINIEQETTKQYNQTYDKQSDGTFVKVNPTQYYNVDLMLTANFDVYDESLKFIDCILLFFQENAILDSTVYAQIPEGIKKLEFFSDKIDYSTMHNLWSALGAKYQPSLIYRMRLISVQSDQIGGINKGIEGGTITATP
jgi:hypothetical protein